MRYYDAIGQPSSLFELLFGVLMTDQWRPIGVRNEPILDRLLSDHQHQLAPVLDPPLQDEAPERLEIPSAVLGLFLAPAKQSVLRYRRANNLGDMHVLGHHNVDVGNNLHLRKPRLQN